MSGKSHDAAQALTHYTIIDTHSNYFKFRAKAARNVVGRSHAISPTRLKRNPPGARHFPHPERDTEDAKKKARRRSHGNTVSREGGLT